MVVSAVGTALTCTPNRSEYPVSGERLACSAPAGLPCAGGACRQLRVRGAAAAWLAMRRCRHHGPSNSGRRAPDEPRQSLLALCGRHRGSAQLDLETFGSWQTCCSGALCFCPNCRPVFGDPGRGGHNTARCRSQCITAHTADERRCHMRSNAGVTQRCLVVCAAVLSGGSGAEHHGHDQRQ